MMSTHSSLFVLFTRSPRRIRRRRWKQRMMSMHSLFFTEFAENTLEATREKGDSIGVLFVVCALHEVSRKNSATPLETESEWCRSTHFSLFLLFTRSPGRIRRHHWKQRMCTMSTHSLFFTKFSENTLEATREKGDSIGVLFVVSTLHGVSRKDSVKQEKR